jgi:hypothetical protein
MRRSIYSVAVSIAVIVALSSPAGSQTEADSITIGSVVLRLGHPKSRVLSELGRKYDLQPVSESNGRSFMLKGKEDSTSSFYGALVFDEHGELATATKYWLPEIRVYKPEDVVLAIYGVVKGFVNQGNRNCVINTDQHHSPGPAKEIEIVIVRCGLKALMISQARTSDSVSVGVAEILSKPNDVEPRIVDQ